MRKAFKLQDLDCANCAAKIENSVKKLEGVNNASVNFMMQKMTVEADETRFDEVMDNVVKLCHKVEPDMVIVR